MNRSGLVLVLSLLVASPLAASFARADVAEKEVDDAIAAFKKAYASREESARISAVEALAATQHRRVIEALAAPLARDPSAAVRRVAAAALGKQWSPLAVPVLARALDAENAPQDVTDAIIQALGHTESDEAVPALTALLGVHNKFAKDQDVSLFTSAALRSLARIGSARATEDVIAFLSREANVQHIAAKARLGPEPLIKDAIATLTAITGERLQTPAQWRVWWSEHRGGMREIPVYRCPQTGRTFDRPDARVKCPHDGDQHPGCGVFLKTRYENGGLGVPEAPAAEAKKAKKKQ